MPSHNEPAPNGGRLPEHIPGGREPEAVDIMAGYEVSDVRITGVAVFIISLAIFVVVAGVLCYGIGAAINSHLDREDGPTNKWSQTVNIRSLGDMPSAPAEQNKVAELTQSFPTPRLQTDDGNEDLAELRERENLLLTHYSWIDQSKGTVRIPIERAMELLAQHGLPVAPAAPNETLMTGDIQPVVTMPLTDGYAPTAYEQEMPNVEGNNVLDQPSAGKTGVE